MIERMTADPGINVAVQIPQEEEDDHHDQCDRQHEREFDVVNRSANRSDASKEIAGEQLEEGPLEARARIFRMLSTISTVLVPGWREIARMIPRVPLFQAIVLLSWTLSMTLPTSRAEWALHCGTRRSAADTQQLPSIGRWTGRERLLMPVQAACRQIDVALLHSALNFVDADTDVRQDGPDPPECEPRISVRRKPGRARPR